MTIVDLPDAAIQESCERVQVAVRNRVNLPAQSHCYQLEPLEDKNVTISQAQGSLTLSASFQLIAAMN